MIGDFSELERQQYQRHLQLKNFGPMAQQRLHNCSVVCVGAGGLGVPVLQYLVAAGLGTISIIDDDVVEQSNLQRQVIYSHDDLGKSKVLVAAQRLRRLNPLIAINTKTQRLCSDNAESLLANHDILIDASDNQLTRYLLNDYSLAHKTPWVGGSVHEFFGQCMVFTGQGPCYRCLFPEAAAVANCNEAGILGVIPGIIGTLQALEVIKLASAIGSTLKNCLLQFDGRLLEQKKFVVEQDPHCLSCVQFKPYATLTQQEEQDKMKVAEITSHELVALRDTKHDFLLLDVREPHEHDICHLSSLLIPLGQLPERIAELPRDQKIIVYCKSGGRSRQACYLLLAHGFMDVSNLTGGILGWIDEQDASLSRY